MVATPVTVAVPIAVAVTVVAVTVVTVAVCVSVVVVSVSVSIAVAIIATRRGDHRRCAGASNHGACAVAALAGVACGLRSGIAGAPDGCVVAGVSGQAGRRCRAAGEAVRHLVEIQLHLAERGRNPRDPMPGCYAAAMPMRRQRRRYGLAGGRQAGSGNGHALDGGRPRLAMFDRAEGARSAEREARLAMGKRRGALARHHLRDLTRLEIGDLDLTPDDVDAGAGGAHRDAKLRAFDDGGEVGRLDLEMLDVLLLDLE